MVHTHQPTVFHGVAATCKHERRGVPSTTSVATSAANPRQVVVLTASAYLNCMQLCRLTIANVHHACMAAAASLRVIVRACVCARWATASLGGIQPGAVWSAGLSPTALPMIGVKLNNIVTAQSSLVSVRAHVQPIPYSPLSFAGALNA